MKKIFLESSLDAAFDIKLGSPSHKTTKGLQMLANLNISKKLQKLWSDSLK